MSRSMADSLEMRQDSLLLEALAEPTAEIQTQHPYPVQPGTLVAKNYKPFVGVQIDIPKVYTFGKRRKRKLRILTYQAWDAGVIGPEDNGVAIVDDDAMHIVCTQIAREDTGYFGITIRQWKAALSLAELSWDQLAAFLSGHPMARFRLDPAGRELF